MKMRAVAVLFFLATALSNAFSAIYIFGAYMSGLPIKWWSGPFVLLILAASLGIGIAGLVVFFSPRIKALALFSGGLLELFLVTGLIHGVTAWVNGRVAWGPFTQLILVPFALTTPSMVLAFRLQPTRR